VRAASARRYQRSEECDSAIAEPFNRYEFDMTVRQRQDGQWSCELSKAGRPLLISPRTHSSPKSCGYAIRRMKRLLDSLARASGTPRGARARPEVEGTRPHLLDTEAV
jgi:hypothetical protein